MGIIVGPEGAVQHQTSGYVALRESITDVARQIEDLNWVNLSTDRPAYDLVYDDRKRLIQRIRLYRRRSPLAKQAAALLQHYALGRGVTLKANNKAMVARLVDEFWEDPVNLAVFTSHQSQKEAIDNLFTDGDLFIVLFPDSEAGTLHLGLLDAISCDDIITDPDNNRVPKWYKVRRPDAKYDFQSGSWQNYTATDYVYYRDWRNVDDVGGKGSPPKKQIADGLIYHVRINRRGKFGESELATAVDWLKSHKDFMEDRVSLNRAAAQIAWKKKRKGGANDIAAEVTKLQSSMVNNIARYESNPPFGTASTIVENEGTSMDWVKTDTGASNALADERILRMMAGSGMGGIPNHYFGDEANANLATATAMELPLLKTYEDWQQVWSDMITDLVNFMLEVAHEAGRIGPRDDSSRYAERVTAPKQVLQQPDVKDQTGQSMTAGKATAPKITAMKEADGAPAGDTINVRDPSLQISMMPKTEPVDILYTQNDQSGAVDWFVDVDFPPIIQKDQGMMMTALKTLYEFLPTGNIESQKLVVEMALMTMGQNNTDEVMERLFPVDAAGNPIQPESTPADAEALVKALGPLLAQAAPLIAPPAATAQIGPGAGAAKNVTPPAERAVAESLAEYRVKRVLRAARDASISLAALDGSADFADVG